MGKSSQILLGICRFHEVRRQKMLGWNQIKAAFCKHVPVLVFLSWEGWNLPHGWGNASQLQHRSIKCTLILWSSSGISFKVLPFTLLMSQRGNRPSSICRNTVCSDLVCRKSAQHAEEQTSYVAQTTLGIPSSVSVRSLGVRVPWSVKIHKIWQDTRLC